MVYTEQVARKTAYRLYKFRALRCNNTIIRRPCKLIVTTYVIPMVTYAHPEWGYLAKAHKPGSAYETKVCAGPVKPIT